MKQKPKWGKVNLYDSFKYVEIIKCCNLFHLTRSPKQRGYFLKCTGGYG